MTKQNIQVWIPTTQGICRVLGLVAEDPDVQSVVCLNHSTEALPISGAYHQFVRKGTGIIHRHVGHGAFRLDVDHRVDQGSSWQLPVFCAHILLQQGRLWQNSGAAAQQPAQQVWVATGTVNVQGDIGAVTGFAEKLLHLYEALRQQPRVSFQLFFSQHNQADVAAALLTLDEPVRQFFSQYPLVWLANVSDITSLYAPVREQKVTVSLAPGISGSAAEDAASLAGQTQTSKDLAEPEAAAIQAGDAIAPLPTASTITESANNVSPAPTSSAARKPLSWLHITLLAALLLLAGFVYWLGKTPNHTSLEPTMRTTSAGEAAPMLRWASCQQPALVSQVATTQGRVETDSLCQLQIEVPAGQRLVIIKMPESAIVKSGTGVLKFTPNELPPRLSATGYQLLLVQFSQSQPETAVFAAIAQARTFDFISAADLSRQLTQQGFDARVYQQVWQVAF